MELEVDPEGRLVLPADLCREAGWEPGAHLLAEPGAGRLTIRPADAAASPTAAFRERVRDFAESIRHLPAADRVREMVSSLASKPPPTGLPFHSHSPYAPETCYVSPAATLIGDVALGEDCSVWPGAVLRGDVNAIRVGARTNIQDGAVLHVNPGEGNCVIGASVTIGHQAMVHSCKIADHVIIGIHAVVLDGARVGERCIIGAGAVVTPGTIVPPGKLVLGVPGRVVRDLTPQEIESIFWHADSYVSLKNEYLRPQPSPPPAPASIPAPAPPAAGELPRYQCRRVREPVVIDGALSEPFWGSVPPLSPLQLASGGGPPALATEVKACWDERCLYVAFSCHDSDVWGTLSERDQPLYDEEVVEVFLSPTGDLAHYFEFEVSPLNTIFDAKVFNPNLDRATMLVDADWNAAGIRTGVGVAGTLDNRSDVDLGWIAELAIPFADLGLAGAPSPGSVWRANFYRIERGAVEEFSAWSPTYKDPPDFHVPACFGELVFVE
jgi:carbonic anhydrase/acetyltransferase-like protein (isoleucine patch superfamily)/bifunctional DNA-binding transcriptional regulator/antitoxin component of YhaV-PrlF toxin-antitoxin module